MSNVMDEFPNLKDKTLGELHQRYNQLKDGPRDGPNGGLSDVVLQELVAIARVLRGRASAPAAKASKRVTPTLDAL